MSGLIFKNYPNWINEKLKIYINEEKRNIEINNINDYNKIVFDYSIANNDYKFFFSNFLVEKEFSNNHENEYFQEELQIANINLYLLDYIIKLLFKNNNDDELEDYYNDLIIFLNSNKISKDFIVEGIDLNIINYILKLRWFNKCEDKEFIDDNYLFITKLKYIEKILKLKINIDEYLLFYLIKLASSDSKIKEIYKTLMKYYEYSLLLEYIILILEHTKNLSNNILEETNKILNSLTYIVTNEGKEKINELRQKHNLIKDNENSYLTEVMRSLSLNSKSKLLYIQADELIKIYDKNNVIDYSNICLQYCRILEITIKDEIIKPVIKKIGTEKINMYIKNYNQNNNTPLKIKNIEKIELGPIRELLNVVCQNQENEFFEEIYKTANENCLNHLINTLDQKKLNKYRNPPAHTGLASRKICIECKEWVDDALLSIALKGIIMED